MSGDTFAKMMDWIAKFLADVKALFANLMETLSGLMA